MPHRPTLTLAGVLATVAVAGLARPAAAQFTVTFTQVGSDVVATGIGSIDLRGLSLLAYGNSGGNVQSGYSSTGYPPNVFNGPPPTPNQLQAAYVGNFTFPAFGTANHYTFATSGTGDVVGAGGSLINVPKGYVSGSALADQSTYANQTFATLGLTPGTYQETWDNGNGSFTVSVVAPAAAPTTAPEPSTWALLGTGLLAVGGLARRRTPRA